MIKKKKTTKRHSTQITGVTIEGFKSIKEPLHIRFGALTILAGANSSGKSSIFQPLLLLKQTLESAYDPGPLLINGPNVKFSAAEQLFTAIDHSKRASTINLEIFLERKTTSSVLSTFLRNEPHGITLSKTEYRAKGKSLIITPKMSEKQIIDSSDPEMLKFIESMPKNKIKETMTWSTNRDRCFLECSYGNEFMRFGSHDNARRELLDIIHLPGLRGNPIRTYPVSAVGKKYSGTFEVYTASILLQWHKRKAPEMNAVNRDLKDLGLCGSVIPKAVNDTQVEIHVNRLAKGVGEEDTVNIADVGLGVSQILPLVVALNAASPGQLLFIEQPEIHLHPRAQQKLALVLSRAISKGVQLVIETHSNLLILGIQTLVAKKKISPDTVQLHWFSKRVKDGVTTVRSANLNNKGQYGDWPEDFADVILKAENDYLNSTSN